MTKRVAIVVKVTEKRGIIDGRENGKNIYDFSLMKYNQAGETTVDLTIAS